MRRAAILTTLALLFLTVTGITVAQERNSNLERGQQTGAPAQGATTTKSTKPSGEGSTKREEPGAKDAAQNSDKPKADRAKATEGKAAKSKAENVGKSTDTGETEDADKPPEKSRSASAGGSSDNGKAEGANKATIAPGKAEGAGKPASKPAGVGKTEDAGKGKAKGKGWAKGKGKAKGSGEAESGSGQ